MSANPCHENVVVLPVLFAALLGTASTAVQARPANGPNCANAGCHGNPVLDTSPGSGGTLRFGANGRTLVGESSTADFVLRNLNTKIPRGGGFTGAFPSTPAGSEFGAPASLTMVGDTVRAAGTAAGYLTPQLGSESRAYTYRPTARGADTLPLTFTPLLGYLGVPPTVSVTFQGQGVARAGGSRHRCARCGQRACRDHRRLGSHHPQHRGRKHVRARRRKQPEREFPIGRRHFLGRDVRFQPCRCLVDVESVRLRAVGARPANAERRRGAGQRQQRRHQSGTRAGCRTGRHRGRALVHGV